MSSAIWIVLIGAVLVILGAHRERWWVSGHGFGLAFIGIGLYEGLPILIALGAVGIALIIFILEIQHFVLHRRGDEDV
jgi:hypothetical protein